MSLSAKQQKEMSFLDSLTSLTLSPFQSLFTQSVQSVSEVINIYFYLVSVSKENERLKLEVDKLGNEKNELIERISRQKRLAGLMATRKTEKKIHWLLPSLVEMQPNGPKLWLSIKVPDMVLKNILRWLHTLV